MAKINWSKVVNYRAREIQIRMPGCPTHYTNVQRAMDTLKNPAFWMFVVTVVLTRLMIFEWLFYCFFLPIIEKRGATQGIETVVLGEHTLKVLDILYVQVMEHHVCIYKKEGELVERSRFRDLMQILNDIDGVQPHRS
jgi:hypothetical protein